MEIEENLFIIHAMGRDRAGLIAMLSKIIANAGYNIIDIEESAPHGIFWIILVIEPTEKALSNAQEYFKQRFDEVSAGSELDIYIRKYIGGLRRESKLWTRIVFVGPDRPGIIATIADYVGKNNANIQKMNMIARGEIIASEILIDISEIEVSIREFHNGIRELGKKIGLQVIIESEDIFKKKKRKLMVMDLDQNLISIQGLENFIQKLKIYNISNPLIEQIKNIEDKEKLKELGLKLMKDMQINTINEILCTLRISPGTEELIRALKLMNYHIAIISNSISLFIEKIKNRLELEYAFGETIEIKEGKITGQYVKDLKITPRKKVRLINWLANMEKVPEAEISHFALDEKDPLFSHFVDLKVVISFDWDKIESLISSGKCTILQILGLLLNIGMHDLQLMAMKKFL